MKRTRRACTPNGTGKGIASSRSSDRVMNRLRVSIEACPPIRIIELRDRHGEVHIRAIGRVRWPIVGASRKHRVLGATILPDEATHVTKAMAGPVQPQRPLAV